MTPSAPTPAASSSARTARLRRLRRLGAACALLAGAIGAISLLGWILGNDLLKGAFAARITVKTNTAIALLLLGGAALLLAPERRSRFATVFGRAFALVATAIGLATLGQHVFGWSLGIDEFLFREAGAATATQSPNRMGPPASLGFTLLGLALVLLDRRGRGGRVPAQALALVAFLVCLVPLLGYALDVSPFYGVAHLTGIALQTAFALALLSIAILCARPERGFVRRLVGDDSGALLIRRLLPAAVALPILITWLRLIGEGLGLYDREFGRVLLALAFIVVFAAITWWTGTAVARQEAAGARAESELRRRHEHSLELMSDAFVSVDRDWRVTYLNAAAERVGGTRRQDILGRSLWDAFPEARGGELEQRFRQAMSERNPERFETVHAASGRAFEAEIYPSPDGGLAAYGRDVTDHRHALAVLRESEELFRTLGEAVPDFLWMADGAGDPIWQNPAWRAYTGLTGERLRELGWQSVVHADEGESLARLWEEAAASGTPFRIEMRMRRHDGSWRWFSCRTVPLKDGDGRVKRWIGTGTDIDELRRSQEILRDADRRKNTFLATLAHELRNPLAPVRNAVQLLRLKGAADGDAQWAHQVIERQVTHLSRLIDDLMDVSRIERNKLELQRTRVPLSHVLTTVIDGGRPLLAERGHTLLVETPEDELMLDADPVRLVQVFTNLYTNAIKYTPPGGRIVLRAEREGSDVVVSVIDTGVGIAEEEQPRLFEMFFQASADASRADGGLGIGLALVRHLVELHGGHVSASSAGEGQGSTFTVRLPLAPILPGPAPPAPTGEHAGEETLRGRRILIVDDNRDAAISLGVLLRRAGARVDLAHDGQEALAAAAASPPDVVVLDLGLPRRSGYEVATELRHRPGGQDLVLIALTGWGQEADRTRSKDAGFDHHLVKPVEPDALFRLLLVPPADPGPALRAPGPT